MGRLRNMWPRRGGHPIINDLVNNAVKYWMQSKQEILCSSRLGTSDESEDYFRGTNIADPHNVFWRKMRRLRLHRAQAPDLSGESQAKGGSCASSVTPGREGSSALDHRK